MKYQNKKYLIQYRVAKIEKLENLSLCSFSVYRLEIQNIFVVPSRVVNRFCKRTLNDRFFRFQKRSFRFLKNIFIDNYVKFIKTVVFEKNTCNFTECRFAWSLTVVGELKLLEIFFKTADALQVGFFFSLKIVNEGIVVKDC